VGGFAYDLRFSVRSFVGSPSFAATAVLSLALGIGATTALYSLVDQVVLRALPVREPGRLVIIDWNGLQATVNAFGSYNLMSYPLCRGLQYGVAASGFRGIDVGEVPSLWIPAAMSAQLSLAARCSSIATS